MEETPKNLPVPVEVTTARNTAFAASNAATLLAKARVSFFNKDLQGVHIPDANLFGGVFSLTDFSKADLRGVNLWGACLTGANFTDADMTDIEFGEWLNLEEICNVKRIFYSPDGCYLSILKDKDIDIFEKIEGEYEYIQTLTGHTDFVTSIAYSPDGSQLVSGSQDGSIRLWDMKSGKETQTLTGHTSSVNCVTYSPDGKQLASGSRDGNIWLWDMESGETIHPLRGSTSSVNCVAYSPDGNKLAWGYEDKTLCFLWDVKSGNRIYCTLAGHTSSINCVAYSPDGSQLASGSRDGNIQLWDVESGKKIYTLREHIFSVNCVAYSPDSKQLVSGGNDTTVRLWDVKSGQKRQILKGHTRPVNSTAYSPDGSQLASGSEDYAIFIWQKVETILQVERWVIKYRFPKDCMSLSVHEAILDNAVISMENFKLLQQRDATTDPIFASFFNPRSLLSEVGKQITPYLNPRDRQAIACMKRSSYSFFKTVVPPAQPTLSYESTSDQSPNKPENTTFFKY